jgi:hypothetical protein
MLANGHIDPQQVIVMRHRPHEPELRKVLPWLAAEKPDVFNAFQKTQSEKAEKASGAGRAHSEGRYGRSARPAPDVA